MIAKRTPKIKFSILFGLYFNKRESKIFRIGISIIKAKPTRNSCVIWAPSTLPFNKFFKSTECIKVNTSQNMKLTTKNIQRVDNRAFLSIVFFVIFLITSLLFGFDCDTNSNLTSRSSRILILLKPSICVLFSLTANLKLLLNSIICYIRFA